MFGRKKTMRGSMEFDGNSYRPVIRCSICNGEQVAGFREIETGKFTEIMLLKSPSDLDTFCQKYGLKPDELKKEY